VRRAVRRSSGSMVSSMMSDLIGFGNGVQFELDYSRGV